MAFDAGLTVASLFIGVGIIAVGFTLAGDPQKVQIWRTVIVGCVGGFGVAAMHYTGMFAMVSQASVDWNAGVIVASVIVGCVAATAALLIFFHMKTYWQDDVRLQLLIALIMALAVNSTRYTGMVAAHWTKKTVAPDFTGYARPEVLTVVLICMAVVTCGTLMTVLLFQVIRSNKLHKLEAKKTQSLILSVLVRDHRNRILATLTNTLPSVVIDQAVGANTTFDALSPDFLRMLKISFSWGNAIKYQRHLARLHAEGNIPASSLRMLNQFVDAANSLASLLHIPLDHLGFLFWQPCGSMVTLCVKTTPSLITSIETSVANSNGTLTGIGLRFMLPQQMKAAMQEFQLPKEWEQEAWIKEVTEYQRRVLLPPTGGVGSLDEPLNELLRDIAHELLLEKEGIEDEILSWRALMGRFVNSRRHLKILIADTEEWKNIKLDPMVKAQLKKQIIGAAGVTSTNKQGDTVQRDNSNDRNGAPRLESWALTPSTSMELLQMA